MLSQNAVADVRCKLIANRLVGISGPSSENAGRVSTQAGEYTLNVEVNETVLGPGGAPQIKLELSGPVSFESEGALSSRTSDGTKVAFSMKIRTPDEVEIVCVRYETLTLEAKALFDARVL